MENLKTSNLSDAEKLKMLFDALSTNDVKMNAKVLAEKTGYKSHMVFYHVLSGRNRLNDDMIENIVLKFPQVNYMFLKKGIGKPIKSKAEAQLQTNLLGLSKKSMTLDDIAEIPGKLMIIQSQLDRINRKLFPEDYIEEETE